jgi:hypothetical protein
MVAIRMDLTRCLATTLFAAASLLAGNAKADATATLARMTPGYTYFNRPGASVQDHERDVTACARLAGSVRSREAIAAGDTLFSPVIPAAGQRSERALATASLENCMVVRGWRVVRAPNPEGMALASLDPGDLLARLSPWIGATVPHGGIVRSWDNDAARRSSSRFGGGARTKNGQLSLLAAAPELRQLPPAAVREPPSPWTNPSWPRGPIKPEALAHLRADAGILLIEMKGEGLGAGSGLILNREGTDENAWPSLVDHAPDKVAVGGFGIFHSGVLAYVLPPGSWRIYGIGLNPTLNLCLGSPSFQIKAGEVLFAGTFDLGAEDIGPDLDLAPAQIWLGPAASRVRTATYTNGSLGPCGDNSIYALEFKNASFRPGYAWGSRAAPHE